MGSKFHAFMFPWFAFGHMTPFLHLANKLAQKGHKVTFLLPKKAQTQLQPLNLFPENINFHPLTIPPVNGLPIGVETASDIPISLGKFLFEAMDLTRDQVEAAVGALKPDLIFFDFAYWVPEMAKEYKIKSVMYNVLSASTIAHTLFPGEKEGVPAQDYPSSKVLLHENDAYTMSFITPSTLKRIRNRSTTGLMNCDVILLRTCQEIEGKFCDYLERKFQRKVILTGPMLPEQEKSTPLEDKWSTFLGKFEPGTVVFCALGSQITLEKDQFQELCLGIELTGLPFLVAVKPPKGSSTIQEALPEGFEERVKGRGIVYGGWVQQPLILSHKSVGCFVNHCGFGSMWESLLSDCQIVLLPFLNDQILNTRLMSEELQVSVEVPRQGTGWFSKESLRDAIKSVTEKESKVGNLVRSNRTKWKQTLVSNGVMNGYVDKFVEELQNLSKSTDSVSSNIVVGTKNDEEHPRK